MISRENVPPRKHLSEANLRYRGIPASYISYTLQDYKASREKKNFYKAYLDNLNLMYKDRVCILQCGANGTGKTMLASLVVKEGYRLRYNTCMITLSAYINLLFKQRTPEEQDYLNYIQSCEFLVIDELGKENFTASGSNINVLEDLLRNATQKGQVIILNTNLNKKELFEQYGASIKSLVDGDYTTLKFKEEDYRPIVKKNDSRKILAEALKC